MTTYNKKTFRTTMTLFTVMLMTAAALIGIIVPLMDRGGGSDDKSTVPPTDGSSSSGKEKTYAISKGRTSNGDISFSADEARPGDTFTACITPSAGYSVATYLVDGVEHDIEDAQKGQPYYVYDLVQKEGGTTIGATFVANTYTVSFQDMEKGRSFDPITVTYDRAIALPSTHADVFGYTVGWHDSDSVSYSSGQTWKVANDVTLYSTWYYDTYTMTLDPNGGKFADGTAASTTATVGYEQPWRFAEPARDGYTFSGWYQGEDLVASEGTSWTQYTEDKVLKAKWTGNTYSVSYDVNGGGMDDSSPTEVTYGESYALKTPTRKGYSFGGWYYDGSAVSSSTWGIAGSVTVVAQWTANEYTVGLNPNGGTVGKATAKVTYDSSWSLETPERDGYDFLGWYDGDTKVESTGTKWNRDGDVDLTAKWDAQTYSISFDTDGGTSKNPVDVTYDSSYDLGVDPTKEGFTFSGWLISGTTASVASSGTKWTFSTSSITLKATWTNSGVRIYLNPNGGKIDDSASVTTQLVTYGGSYSFAEPARVGYKFAGWHTAASGGVRIDSSGSSWTYSETTTNLYAQWTAEQYTVTLNPNGGRLDDSTDIVEKKVTYDSTWNFGTPEYDGYTFSGWYDGSTKVDTSGDAWQHSSSDVSLTAKWTPKTLTITLDPDKGTLAGSSSVEIEYNGKWSISDPARTGHTFSGWKTESGTPVSSRGDHWTYTTDGVKLVAQWTADDVKVTFDAGENGTANGTSTTIKYEGSWDFSSYAPTPKNGYSFEGWYSDAALTEGISSTGTSWTLAEGSITLYAKYTENQVSVALNAGAGDAKLTDGSTVPTTYNGSYSFKQPTRDGYTFAGWRLKDGTSVAESGSWTYSYDNTAVTVTAQWTANDINVKFDAGEGTVKGTSSYSFKYDGAYEITATAERDDFTFGGWYIDDEKATISAKGDNWTYTKGGDVTLHAKWIPVDYTITLNPNGGSVTETSITVNRGSSYELPTPTTTDTNKAFDGWYDSNDKKWELTGTYDVSGDTTLTAKWKTDYSNLAEGDSFSFGKYPRTKVSDETLNTALDALVIDKGWTSYDYYVSGAESDIMKWQDVNYGGNKYRGVRITALRPTYTTQTSPTNNYQSGNGYVASDTEIYWFKYESISWKVLKKDASSMLVRTGVLDSQQYYHTSNTTKSSRSTYDGASTESVFDNNYMYSDIRGWLNTSFYDWAFSDDDKSYIATTEVDNSTSTTSTSKNAYACSNTNDKVFLLSYSEYNRSSYFSNSYARLIYPTDYAKCQGAYSGGKTSGISGLSWYWTRSPDSGNGYRVSYVRYDGSLDNSTISECDVGVLPAITIKIS